jgi:hypothetical protein
MPGQTALRHAHDRFEREGVPVDRLPACQDEHRTGTSLPGCLKVYLPDSDGDWRMIFQIATDEAGPLLSYLGCGVGHQPRGTRAPDGHQIAHHRLHRPMAPDDGCHDATDAAPNDRAATLSVIRTAKTARYLGTGDRSDASDHSRSHQAQRRDYPTSSISLAQGRSRETPAFMRLRKPALPNVTELRAHATSARGVIRRTDRRRPDFRA